MKLSLTEAAKKGKVHRYLHRVHRTSKDGIYPRAQQRRLGCGVVRVCDAEDDEIPARGFGLPVLGQVQVLHDLRALILSL